MLPLGEVGLQPIWIAEPIVNLAPSLNPDHVTL
jgi:hypothetical protein